jgi:hypothetical protein
MVVVTSFLMGTCGGKLTRSSVVVDGNFVQVSAALPAVIKNKFLRELQLLSVVWLLNNNLGHTTTTPIFCKFLNLPSIHVTRLVFSFATSSHFPLNKKRKEKKRHKQQKTGKKEKKNSKSICVSEHESTLCLFVCTFLKRDLPIRERGEKKFQQIKRKTPLRRRSETHPEKQAVKITKPTRTRRSTAAATTHTKRHTVDNVSPGVNYTALAINYRLIEVKTI